MSRKGEAKRRKAERLRNKKLIARYPWIRPVDWHWQRIKGYAFTMYDDVPKGWKRAFGKIMLEDYREVLIKHGFLDEFQWVQVKEKYGTLRLYSNAAPEEIYELEHKYDYISGHICIKCGRINVPTLTGGWVEPLCKDCYNKGIEKQRRWHVQNHKDGDFTYTPYEDLHKSMHKIEMVVKYKCFSKEKGDHVKKCDYSDTIDKIMKRQEKLFSKEEYYDI